MSSTVASSITTLCRNGGNSVNVIPRDRESLPAAMDKDRRQEPLMRSMPKYAGPSNTIIAEPWATKGRKRASPFRIKAGCLVALRHREGGNNVTAVSPTGKAKDLLNLRSSDHFFEIWTDPMPGRDEGLALIGRRVRCYFPKSVTLEDQPKRATTRMLEGEIVAIVDYQSNWHLQRQRRRNREPCHFTVELLVDESALISMPFLERVDDKVDWANLRSVEKKRRRYEEIIRGNNKITVKVALADQSGIIITKTTLQSSNLLAKWVIRKRIPLHKTAAVGMDQLWGENCFASAAAITPSDNGANVGLDDGASSMASQTNGGCVPEFGTQISKNSDVGTVVQQGLEPPKKRAKLKKNSNELRMRYLGDGNDSPRQQEANWRWWACRSHDMEFLACGGKRLGCLEQISYGFVGEVLSLETGTSPVTLAIVTLRRMILPEHTVNGRIEHDGPFQLYDDRDSIVETKAAGNATCNDFVTFRVPVEELIILSRGITRSTEGISATLETCSHPTVALSYSLQCNLIIPNSYNNFRAQPFFTSGTKLEICHKCRITLPTAEMTPCDAEGFILCQGNPTEPSRIENWWCPRCIRCLPINLRGELRFPCPLASCDCRQCLFLAGSHLQLRLHTDVTNAISNCSKSELDKMSDSLFAAAHKSVTVNEPADFNLPFDLFDLVSLPLSSGKPYTRIPKVRPNRKESKSPDKKNSRRAVECKSRRKNITREKNEEQLENHDNPLPTLLDDKEQPLRLTCSRILPYDPASKLRRTETAGNGFGLLNGFDMPRNLRQLQLLSAKPEKEDRTNNSRAARANQRRIMKDVAALGATSLGLDTLAGREQKLRFDRSGIHAWGVFADVAIAAGDMIVEYRGELIGNAMAEKREKEYERAKIGSDYMFRVDSQVVCDATKQGNVARFINASCDPNCYTKTITVDGIKRIVIYAKRDICAGEELCYDYKFPVEFDETKRIPCYCGARECRGFMNWNKRYVALPIHDIAAPLREEGKVRRVSLKHTGE